MVQTKIGDLAPIRLVAWMNKRLAATNRLVEERTRELELANQILMRLSTHDGLTGVGNRRRFDEALDIEWRRASAGSCRSS